MPISKDQFELDTTLSRQQFEENASQLNSALDTPTLPERFAKDTAVYSSGLRGMRQQVPAEELGGEYTRLLSRMREEQALPKEVEELQQFIAEDDDAERRRVVESVLKNPDISDEEKEETVRGLIELRRAGVRPSLREEYARKIAFADASDTVQGTELQTDRLYTLSEMLAINKYQASIVSSIIERGAGDSAGEKLAEFGELIVPFVEQKSLLMAAAKAGFDIDAIDPVLMGSFKRETYNTILNMPVEQRIPTLQLLAEGIREHDGLFLEDNELMQLAAFESVLREGGPENWEVWLDNAVGILDLAGVGATLKGLIGSVRGARTAKKASDVAESATTEKPRFVYKGTDPKTGKPRLKLKLQDTVGVRAGSPLDTTTLANPDVGGRLAVSAIVDGTSNTADALGSTKADIVFTHALPKWPGYDLKGAPADVTARLERFNTIQDNVSRRTESMGIAFTESERQAARLNIVNRLDNVSGLGVHLPRTTLRYNDEGMETTALYGPNSDHGFRTRKEAEEARAWSFGESDEGSRVVFNRFADDKILDPPDPRLDVKTGIRLDDVDASGKEATLRFNDAKGNWVATAFVRNNGEDIRIEDIAAAADVTGQEGKNTLGLSNVRGMARLVKREFPNAKTLSGFRAGGVRQGGDFVPGVEDTGEAFTSINLERAATETGQYFIEKTARTTYNTVEGSIFGSGGARGWIQGYKSGFLKDATSRFERFVREPAIVSNENAALIEQSVLREVARAWPKNQKAKERVSQVLVKGDSEAKNYSWTELRRDHGLSEAEASSYMAYRQGMDVLWTLQNRDMYRTLNEAGMRTVVSPAWGTTYGKRLDDQAEASRLLARDLPDRETIEMLDAGNKTTRTMSKEEIRNAYQNNKGVLVKMFTPQRTEDGAFDYMWVDFADLAHRNVKFDALGKHPMPYREGHVPRFYNENWIVEEVTEQGRVNGKLVKGKDDKRLRRAISAHESKSGASRAMAKAMEDSELAEKTNVYYNVRPDRAKNNNPAERLQRDWEVMRNRGLTSQRRRGERLGGDEVVPEADYAQARISEPFEAFIRSARATSRHVAYRDVLQTLENRWKSVHPELVEKGAMPTSIDVIRAAGKDAGMDPRDIAQAINEFEYFQALRRGRGGATLDAKLSDVMFDVAASLESSRILPDGVATAAGKAARKVGELEPVRRSRSLAFVAFLALNPLRQALVQTGQLAQLAAIDPGMVLSGKIVKDVSAMWMSAAVRNTGNQAQGYKMAAKMAGMKESEWNRMMNAFWENSGIPHNIDHHLLVAGMADPYAKGTGVTGGIAKRGLTHAKRGVGRVIDTAKMVGFDFGEMNNMMGTWLVARRRWIKQNPGKAADWDSKTNLDEITSLTREMSYTMTEPGRFNYQDGVASVFMQFMSVPHKALLSISSNQLYSKSEKAKIAAANAALFGGAGVPAGVYVFDQVWNNLGFEVDERTRTALNGGLVDLTFNVMADAAFNNKEPSQLLLSENFSPFANTATNIVNYYENMDQSMLDYMTRTVPAASAGSRVLSAAQDLKFVFDPDRPMSEMQDPGEYMKAVKAVASVGSGASNYYKFRFMLEHEKYISATGDETVRATATDAIAKLFGISSQKEKDYYETLSRIYDRKGDLAKDAEWIYDRFKTARNLYDSNPDKAALEMETMHYVMKALPREDRKVVWDNVRRLNAQHRQAGEDHAFGQLLRQQGDMQSGLDGLEGLRRLINNNSAYTKDQQADLISALEKSMKVVAEEPENQ